MNKNKTYLILDNIRSAENVGAIFRTADAVGIDKIFLVGITAAPIDRFGRAQQKIKKTALGAEVAVAWEKKEEIDALIQDLKKQNVFVVAVEQNKKSVDYKDIKIDQDTAFIFGSEVGGISKEMCMLCDVISEIPMKGTKESLNVSVSVGVFLYRVLNI